MPSAYVGEARAAVIIVVIGCQAWKKKRRSRQHDAVTPPAQPWEKPASEPVAPTLCRSTLTVTVCMYSVHGVYQQVLPKKVGCPVLEAVVGLRLAR